MMTNKKQPQGNFLISRETGAKYSTKGLLRRAKQDANATHVRASFVWQPVNT